MYLAVFPSGAREIRRGAGRARSHLHDVKAIEIPGRIDAGQKSHFQAARREIVLRLTL
jgi:hypothetical protein